MNLTKKLIKISKKIISYFNSENLLLESKFKKLISSEYKKGNINVIYDIGAHKGDWAYDMQSCFPNSKVILFEANPDHIESLKSKGYEFHINILSKPGVTECDFYTPDDTSLSSTGASYYKEVTPIYTNLEGRKLKATTLDNLVLANKLSQPDLIKIDTQGSELDVIEGGISTFQAAKWILMELPIIQYNEGAPKFSVYLEKMTDLGFVPVDITELHKFGGILIQLDILFLNKKYVDESALLTLRV